MEIEDIEEEPIKQIKRLPEPRNHYEYCKMIAKTVEMPLWWVQTRTVGWQVRHFEDLRSHCKMYKPGEEIKKIKYIKWFLREGKPKETNLTQI